MIDWVKTWPMITAIGTIVIALGIPITVRIAVLNWRKSKADKKEKYILDRRSLSFGILAELNSIETLLKYLKDCEIITQGNEAAFVQSPKNVNLKLIHKNITILYINSFNDVSYNYFKKSGISYKEEGIIFELSFIYNKIEIIKTLITYILDIMNKENSRFIGNNIIHSVNTMEIIKKDIKKVLPKITNVYEMIKNEINFDFVNSKYYRKYELFVV